MKTWTDPFFSNLRRGLEGLEKYFEFSLPTHATRWVPPAERAESQVRVDSSSMQSVFEWGKTQNSNSKLELTGCSVSPSWFGFMLLVKSDAPFTKSAFAAYLDENKVGNRMLFGGNLLRQPAFVQLKKDRPDAIRTLDFSEQKKTRTENSNSELSTSSAHHSSAASGGYPGADRIMNEAIFIGTYPGLTKLQLDHMVNTIRDFVANCE